MIRNHDNIIEPRIAVVDTGVTGLSDIIQNGISICRLGKSDEYAFEPGFSDYQGHGTDIVSFLSVLCPSAALIPVRIAQQDTVRVPEKALALGIDWCIEQGIRLVNVSYSIEEVSENSILVDVCQKAQKHNVIIVAAYRNNTMIPVYPAAFPNVIGVSILKNSDHGQIAIVSEQNHDVAVFGGPYQIESLHHETRIVSGTSFAAAQVTGMVGRILAVKPVLSFQQVFRYLKKYSFEPNRSQTSKTKPK